MKPTIGIIVGRFQVPELHDGHLELFRAVKARHERVAVFVGLSPTRNATPRHPLDFETRRRMILAKFPEFSILPLLDKRTDEDWSRQLDCHIEGLRDVNGAHVALYGARDSFLPHYSGNFPVMELVLNSKCNGTDIRNALTNTVKESYDFRAGVIYGQQNRRALLYTAVDIAIWNDDMLPGDIQGDGGGVRVLLAQKPGFDMWRFPGGYAEPNGGNFEQDAHREAFEETNLDVSGLEYVSSRTIKDWRYTKETDQIRSILFAGKSMMYGGQASDDISLVKWFRAASVDLETIVPEHREFFNDFLRYLNSKGY